MNVVNQLYIKIKRLIYLNWLLPIFRVFRLKMFELADLAANSN